MGLQRKAASGTIGTRRNEAHGLRSGKMRQETMKLGNRVGNDDDYSLAQPPPGADLDELRAAAKGCRACPLWKGTTCTVFGEGPNHTRLVIIGEQPGDQEDRAGRPFVGPAGRLLDKALAEAGIDRKKIYVTNAVKHFKFQVKGNRRMHDTPNPREVTACRPWLEGELGWLRPDLVVAMGATAARSVMNSPTRVGENRGKVIESPFGKALITIHPSALLRLRAVGGFEPEFKRFVSELRMARKAI